MLFTAPAIQSILDADLKPACPGRILVNTNSVFVKTSNLSKKTSEKLVNSFFQMPFNASKASAEEGQLLDIIPI